MLNTEEIVNRFQNPRKSGRGWIVRCPAHDDRKNSLSLTEGDGKLLIKCQAGCDTKSVIDAVGLEWRDLFADNSNGKPQDPVTQRYVYTDENGQPLYRVCRTASKNFFQERFEHGAYIRGLNGSRRVLFNLPELIKAKTVFVVEGEKDVETLRAQGIPATTNAGGADAWNDAYAESFKGKRVAIIPDNDEPGRRHARKVAKSVLAVAELVKVVELPVPEKGDVTDYLKDHTKEDLLGLLKAAKVIVAEDVKERGESDWPEPKPIQAALYPVPAFDAETLLPDVLREWVSDEAYRMPCPPDYVAATALVALGALIGARCAIKPKAHNDWLIVSNLWGGAVGVPSKLKTPAINAALNPLDRLIAKAQEEYKAALQTFEAENVLYAATREAIEYEMKNAAKTKLNPKKPSNGSNGSMSLEDLSEKFKAHREGAPQEPIPRRYKTNDVTVEKLGELLQQNERGMLVLRDELVGLLASWDREGREGERAFFLEAWNGSNSFDTDRMSRGTILIPNLCVSIFGGIQPDKLTIYLEQAAHALANDGMLQRFQVLVYPDDEPWEYRDRAPNREARSKVFKIFEEQPTLTP